MINKLFILCLSLLLLTNPFIISGAEANPFGQKQKRILVQYSSGTGFFVSRSGYIVTNAHVLQDCMSITVSNDYLQKSSVKLIDKDEELDLAILKINKTPPKVASLRVQITPPNIGDKVMVLGYPTESAQTGKYQVEYSKIIGLRGPLDGDKWIQFDSAAQKGNSGGPLLDFAGNVVGVVTAKTDVYRHNYFSARDELISSSDVAVRLQYLRDYLNHNRVFYSSSDSLMQLSKRRMEATARKFTVNILCKQSEEEVEMEVKNTFGYSKF